MNSAMRVNKPKRSGVVGTRLPLDQFLIWVIDLYLRTTRGGVTFGLG